jgi:hypothetical protein
MIVFRRCSSLCKLVYRLHCTVRASVHDPSVAGYCCRILCHYQWVCSSVTQPGTTCGLAAEPYALLSAKDVKLIVLQCYVFVYAFLHRWLALHGCTSRLQSDTHNVRASTLKHIESLKSYTA